MRVVCKLSFVVRVACLAAVWTWPAAAQAPVIEVTQRWTTRGGPGDEFGAIRGMVEDRAGRIWVSDGRVGVVREFAGDGRHVRTVGRRGEGPGEYRVPGRLVALGDGRIAVHDEARSSIEILEDGRPAGRVRLGATVVNPKGFAALPDGGWLVTGGIFGNPYSVHAFDADGALRTSWFGVPRTEDPQAAVMVAGGPVAVDGAGRLLFARAAPHGLYRFAAPGDGGEEVAAVAGIVPPIGDDFIEDRETEQGRVRTFRWYFPQSRAVLPVGNGRVLNVVVHYPERESTWLLFGSAGERLAEARLPVAYEPWALTADGDVLASYPDPETDEPVAARLAVRLADGHTLAGEPDAPVYELEGLTAEARAARLRLPPMIADFYRRAELGRGQFIMREEIERRRPRELWQLFHGLSSLEVTRTRGGPVLLNRRTNCAPALYLDGVLLGGGRAAGHLGGGAVGAEYTGLLQSLAASTLEGIEYYRGPGETPLEYQGARAMCGVILLWSRAF